MGRVDSGDVKNSVLPRSRSAATIFDISRNHQLTSPFMKAQINALRVQLFILSVKYTVDYVKKTPLS